MGQLNELSEESPAPAQARLRSDTSLQKRVGAGPVNIMVPSLGGFKVLGSYRIKDRGNTSVMATERRT